MLEFSLSRFTSLSEPLFFPLPIPHEDFFASNSLVMEGAPSNLSPLSFAVLDILPESTMTTVS